MSDRNQFVKAIAGKKQRIKETFILSLFSLGMYLFVFFIGAMWCGRQARASTRYRYTQNAHVTMLLLQKKPTAVLVYRFVVHHCRSHVTISLRSTSDVCFCRDKIVAASAIARLSVPTLVIELCHQAPISFSWTIVNLPNDIFSSWRCLCKNTEWRTHAHTQRPRWIRRTKSWIVRTLVRVQSDRYVQPLPRTHGQMHATACVQSIWRKRLNVHTHVLHNLPVSAHRVQIRFVEKWWKAEIGWQQGMPRHGLHVLTPEHTEHFKCMHTSTRGAGVQCTSAKLHFLPFFALLACAFHWWLTMIATHFESASLRFGTTIADNRVGNRRTHHSTFNRWQRQHKQKAYVIAKHAPAQNRAHAWQVPWHDH